MAAILPDPWELASLLCKLFFYLGAASIAGGSLCLWQFTDGRRQSVARLLSYMLLGSLLGFHAELIRFFIQVGQISGAGFSGMFDWGMVTILLDTTVGDVTFYRLGAFIWALLATLLYLRKLKYANQPFSRLQYQRLVAVYVLPLLLLALTLRISGHVSLLPVTAQAAIMVHFIAFTLWIGALYPLLQLTGASDLDLLKLGMRRFGDFAIGIVLLLIAAGVLLVFHLFNSWQELFTTAYGISLLLKLLLVLVLLGIAGINRLYLVPRIIEGASAGALSRSIRIEMLVATLILVVTAYFSTLVGPAD